MQKRLHAAPGGTGHVSTQALHAAAAARRVAAHGTACSPSRSSHRHAGQDELLSRVEVSRRLHDELHERVKPLRALVTLLGFHDPHDLGVVAQVREVLRAPRSASARLLCMQYSGTHWHRKLSGHLYHNCYTRAAEHVHSPLPLSPPAAAAPICGSRLRPYAAPSRRAANAAMHASSSARQLFLHSRRDHAPFAKRTHDSTINRGHPLAPAHMHAHTFSQDPA